MKWIFCGLYLINLFDTFVWQICKYLTVEFVENYINRLKIDHQTKTATCRPYNISNFDKNV